MNEHNVCMPFFFSDSDSLCCRALHWVTIQMLCVSMDEEIPEVSENVVKAITGQRALRRAVWLRLILAVLSFCSFVVNFTETKIWVKKRVNVLLHQINDWSWVSLLSSLVSATHNVSSLKQFRGVKNPSKIVQKMVTNHRVTGCWKSSGHLSPAWYMLLET